MAAIDRDLESLMLSYSALRDLFRKLPAQPQTRLALEICSEAIETLMDAMETAPQLGTRPSWIDPLLQPDALARPLAAILAEAETLLQRNWPAALRALPEAHPLAGDLNKLEQLGLGSRHEPAAVRRMLSELRLRRVSGVVALRPRELPAALPRSAPPTARLDVESRTDRSPATGAAPTAAPAGDEIHDAVTPEEGGLVYRVWFGTNREPVDSADIAKGFTGGRSDTVRHGECRVFVPETHRIGSVGSPWYQRWWNRLRGRKDDRLKLRQLRLLDRARFWQAVKHQLARAPATKRHAVIFIHGFNVSFEDAALRAAQIGADLGVEGAMAFFSWPSQGRVEQYVADGSAIDASEGAITDFLVDFARLSGAEAVHVIAHSMGNRGVLRAVDAISRDAALRSQVRFSNFILAAADVDASVFTRLSAAYGLIARRATLYVSSKDRALQVSGELARFARAGMWPPVQIVPGIDTVDATKIDLTMLGHGYVAEARPVLTDIHELIFADREPAQRFGLTRKETGTGGVYWSFRQ